MIKRAANKTPRREQLLKLLANGEFQSGEALAKRLKVTRAAIWKLVTSLRELGVDIQSVQRQGYRLAHAIELYDVKQIRSHLSVADNESVPTFEAVLTLDSTNHYVTDHPTSVTGQAVLCVAEIQQAGRGRRGRSWLAPFGSGICMSMGWLFDTAPPAFSALSLVVGVALARVLHQLGAPEVGLKWPNDVLWHGRKLAGVLIEMRGEPEGPAHVVIGIGFNLRVPTELRLKLIETQAALVADLHEILGKQAPDRNFLVAAFTAELLNCLRTFSELGFAPFVEEWLRFDALRGTEVKVMIADRTVIGLARGVSSDGSLLLETNDGIQSFVSGEVSVRARVTA